jgi:hypothetical protein
LGQSPASTAPTSFVHLQAHNSSKPPSPGVVSCANVLSGAHSIVSCISCEMVTRRLMRCLLRASSPTSPALHRPLPLLLLHRPTLGRKLHAWCPAASSRHDLSGTGPARDGSKVTGLDLGSTGPDLGSVIFYFFENQFSVSVRLSN